VPIALGLSWRGAILRPVGAWGRRLRPLVAGLWLACVALAFWKLSVAEYVVPAAVAAVVYVALRRSLRRWAPLLAVAAGVAWLYFLGGDSRPLSACRLLGRSPERTARAFARAYLVGDVVGARRLVTSAARPAVEPSSRALAPGAALRRLPPAVFGGGLFCARASRCYAYTGTRGRHTAIVWIGVTCEGTHWRVESFAGG
jgi:hypothetical protein